MIFNVSEWNSLNEQTNERTSPLPRPTTDQPRKPVKDAKKAQTNRLQRLQCERPLRIQCCYRRQEKQMVYGYTFYAFSGERPVPKKKKNDVEPSKLSDSTLPRNFEHRTSI